jgi:uncharacterized cofD-like protein
MTASTSVEQGTHAAEPARSAPPFNVVAVGGGTGLPNVLRGLSSLLFAGAPVRGASADRLVAIVTTTDDGGSSGRLRRDLGLVPPGDIRNCLAALADDRSLLAALFQFRFEAGDGLEGHALGNLMLAALTDVTGNFPQAVDAAARLIGARGRVVPATTDAVTLSAELLDGRTVVGETAIVAAGSGICRLALVPASPRCADAALDAVRNADVVIIGPGSLYTSILPPLLLPELLQAIRLTRAPRVLVLNLMTEPGETDGFDGPRHCEELQRHLGELPFDRVIFNSAPVPAHLVSSYAKRGARPVRVAAADLDAFRDFGLACLGASLACEGPAGRVRTIPTASLRPLPPPPGSPADSSRRCEHEVRFEVSAKETRCTNLFSTFVSDRSRSAQTPTTSI